MTTETISLSEIALHVEQEVRNRDDIRKLRIRAGNRLSALKNFPIAQDVFYLAALEEQLEELRRMERGATRRIEKAMKQHPISDWITKECPGIGLDSTAIILNATGPLNLYDGPAKVWKVLGLAVYPSGENGAGEAPDKMKFARQKHYFNNKKQKADNPYYSGSDYNLKAHGAMRVLGESIEKQPAGTKYKDIINARKAHTTNTQPEWTPIHRRYDANRVAVKSFIKDLWCKWRELGLQAERIRLVIEEDEGQCGAE